ncbi:MAG: EamA family transporter [Aggregatilineales bacterium]
MLKWIAFFALFLIYGSGFMFISVAVEQLTPLELTSIRFLFGSILLLIALYATGGRFPSDWHGLRDLTMVGLLNNTVPFLLVAWAQTQGVASGLTGVLIATNPLFTVVMAHFLFSDERMTRYKIVGLAIGFLGVVVLASRNFSGDDVLTSNLTGQLAVIFSAFCFASAAVYSRKAMQGETSNPLLISAGSTFMAMLMTVGLWVFNIATGTPISDTTALKSETILSVIVLVVVHSFIAFSLVFYVIRELGVTRASMMAYMIPLVSLMLGAIFLDEVLDARVLLATTMILGSLAIANFGRRIVYLLRSATVGLSPSLGSLHDHK